MEVVMNFISKELENYAIEHSTQPGAIANELEAYTKAEVEMPQMLVGKLEASFLSFLIKSLAVKNILEFGTFTGYSSLCMALALPEDGVVHTLDINPDTTKIAETYWKRAGVASKIISHIAPANETLQKFKHVRFDLVFIDADKENYLNYFKQSLELLAPQGIIVIDNVLWGGKILEKSNEVSTQAIQQLNEYIKDLDSVHATLLPVRDGMFLVKKNRQ